LEIQKTLQNDISKKKREIDKLRTDLARKDLELQQASANKVQVRDVWNDVLQCHVASTAFTSIV
jgi:hypothetical protein